MRTFTEEDYIKARSAVYREIPAGEMVPTPYVLKILEKELHIWAVLR